MTKVVVVRLAMDDDAPVMEVLASVIKHVQVIRGAMIVGGDTSQILATGADMGESRDVAELLAADDGDVEPAGTI